MTRQNRGKADDRRFHLILPNAPEAAAQARRQLIRFIEHFESDPRVIADIATAAGEALANAAEHGYRPRGTIRVDACFRERTIEITITDDGPGFFLKGPVSADRASSLSPRGYGLFLMQALVDAIEFRNNGKTVWLQKRLRRTDGSPRS
jgi:anti-sigma regulatory factor (Ser/Thr protein kinase)